MVLGYGHVIGFSYLILMNGGPERLGKREDLDGTSLKIVTRQKPRIT